MFAVILDLNNENMVTKLSLHMLGEALNSYHRNPHLDFRFKIGDESGM